MTMQEFCFETACRCNCGARGFNHSHI